jgi:hypothetical protein
MQSMAHTLLSGLSESISATAMAAAAEVTFESDPPKQGRRNSTSRINILPDF